MGIVILDCGGQYTHLIARRIRQLNVYSEIMDSETSAADIKDSGAEGIILSGGPSSVYEDGSPKIDKDILELGIPVLGLCYGHQLIAHNIGGRVKPGETKEYGTANLNIKDKSSLFANLDDSEVVWMSHGDSVDQLPEGFSIIASTSDCESAAMGNDEKRIYGLQFHPEVTHTPNGMKILENFVDICRCKRNWDMQNYIDMEIEKVKKLVGERKVFLLVSGGVDSVVAFVLLNKALGKERVYGLHIDNGLMRKGESEEVDKELRKHGMENFHVIDASDEFIGALKEKYDPEEKRKIIGNKFIEVKDKEVEKLDFDPDEWVLGQGTIYPDTIETKGTKNAALIKTHHNRVDIIQQLIDQGKVVEPLAQLYKDEIREVGMKLGLPEHLVMRHPFPGPGLGVRVLCSDGNENVDDEDDVNERLNKIANEHGLKAKVVPVKSVGVQGDSRTYRHPAVLIGDADWKTIEKVSTEITNNIKEVNRIIYLLAPEGLGAGELKKEHITKDRLELAREADHIAMSMVEENGLMEEIWQMPTVLVPLSFSGGESIVLRPVFSREAMTAKFAELPMGIVRDISKKIYELNGIDAVFYDVTHKPPATIEWE